MENILNKIDFKIEKENILNDEASYKIIIKIPIEIGWIENMNFNIKTDKETTSYKMYHIKNDSEFAYFETEISLPTRALYHYDFTFKANNKPIKLQNNNYKLSVNFEVPPWAKGKIMYHIFVDRFNKSNNPLPKMKNRTIHNSWDEDIIFKDENGKWNTDFYGGSIKVVSCSLSKTLATR